MRKTSLDQYIDLLYSSHSTQLMRQFLYANRDVLSEKPLHFAVLAKRKEVVALLLDMGVDVNEVDDAGCSALLCAVSNRRTEIVKLLIANNARQVADQRGQTPLQIALMDPDYLVLPILLEDYSAEMSLDAVAGIVTNPNIPDNIRHAAYLYLVAKAPVPMLRELARHMNFNYVDSKGNDAVLVACLAGNTDALIWLSRDKAQPLSLTVKNHAGHSTIETAIAHGQSDLLKECFFKLNLISLYQLGISDSQLVKTAIIHGRVSVLQDLLLHFKISLKDNDYYGANAAKLAIIHGQIEMLAILIKPARKGGYGLSLGATRDDAIKGAIYFKRKKLLHELVKPKSQGGFGYSFNVRKVLEYALNKPEMLVELVRPVSQGGFGLDFNVYNKKPYTSTTPNPDSVKKSCIDDLINAGNKELLSEYVAVVYPDKKSMHLSENLPCRAISNGNEEILEDLVKPIEHGGLGLKLDSRAIFSAILHERRPILLKLITPVQKGGYGVIFQIDKIIQDVLTNRNIKSYYCFFQLLVDHFDKLLFENNLDTALKWMNQVQKTFAQPANNPLDKDYFKGRFMFITSLISAFYKKLLNQCHTSSDAHKLMLALEEVSPQEGHYAFAEFQKRSGYYTSAFHHYLVVFQKSDFALELRLAIGVELVNLILSGKVVLNNKGELDENAAPVIGYDMDLETMQDRAIKAYKYLHGTQSPTFTELRNYLDQILAGNLSHPYDIRDQAIWQPAALIKFNEFYATTAPNLLTEPACIRSQAAANQAQPKTKETVNYSPRFVMPTDAKRTPEAPKPSASFGHK